MTIRVLDSDWGGNTYVVESENQCFIVDAGVPLEELKSIVTKPVLGLLLTHAHFDHIFYLKDYLEYFDTKVYLSKLAVEKLANPGTNLSTRFCEKQLSILLDETQYEVVDTEFRIGDQEIQVVSTPGHSNCSVCFILNNNCFCGDLIFADGIGRTDFEDGNIVTLYRSIKKILATPVENFFPGHGVTFTKEQYQSVLGGRR